MGDPIVTRTTRVWLDEQLGIVRAEALPGSLQTLQDAQENVRSVAILTGGKRVPLMVDLSGSQGIDSGARGFYGSPEGQATYSALALVGSTPVSRMIANTYFAIQRRHSAAMPTKFFASQREAIEWACSLLQGSGATG